MPKRILKFPLKNKKLKIKKWPALSEKSKILKQKRSVYEAKTEIVNTIIEQIKDILKDSIKNKDSTDGIIDTIAEIFQPILNKLKDLIEGNEDKNILLLV